MNNIEILEEFVKEYKDRGYFGIIKAEQLQIVENLIQENKELKRKDKQSN